MRGGEAISAQIWRLLVGKATIVIPANGHDLMVTTKHESQLSHQPVIPACFLYETRYRSKGTVLHPDSSWLLDKDSSSDAVAFEERGLPPFRLKDD